MTTIKLRRGTAAQWTLVNPILAQGEPGFETDTGKHKIGNGITNWAGLKYYVDEIALSNAVSTEAFARDIAINTAVSNLINGAPTALDTLLEISAQLAGDESAVGALISSVSSHVADHNNPHVVTKAQVGLSDVPNVNTTAAIATAISTVEFIDLDTDGVPAVVTGAPPALNLDTAVGSYIGSGGSIDSALQTNYVHGNTTLENTIYVTPRGDDSKTGLSLYTAKATVAGALAALAGAAGFIQIGYGTITETVTWGTVPANTTIRGLGKGLSTILHAFNGNLASLANNVKVTDLTIDGQGATFTGRCFYFDTGTGKQKFRDVALSNWDGYCLEFHESGGSQFTASGLEVNRTSAGTGTGRYAIKISDVQKLTAVPKAFHDLQTQGTCSIDFGGCNNVYISDSALGDLRYTPDTRAAMMVASRILNQAALTVDGHNNAIVSCDLNPQITVAANADNITIGPNSYNNLPIIDNSGNCRNNITHWRTTYTPVLSTTGGVTDLADGTISGWYSRSGDIVQTTITFTVGASTVFGNTGHLAFTLPVSVPALGSRIDHPGLARITQGSTIKFLAAQVYSTTSVRLYDLLTGSLVTSLAPFTLAAGDKIEITLTYNK